MSDSILRPSQDQAVVWPWIDQIFGQMAIAVYRHQMLALIVRRDQHWEIREYPIGPEILAQGGPCDDPRAAAEAAIHMAWAFDG